MRKKLYLGLTLVIIFIIFTSTLLFVDRRGVGPNSSIVGYATINLWFHNLTGVNWVMYTITDYGGIIPILLGLFFGGVGFIQLISRKNIKKVDFELIILGLFYIIVFLIYLLFEYVVINRRPVIIDGYLEASYPSSTTLLSITFLLSAIIPIKRYIKNKKVQMILIIISYLYMSFLVVGRIVSGVHWLTDIIGSILIGFGLVNLYEYIIIRIKSNL